MYKTLGTIGNFPELPVPRHHILKKSTIAAMYRYIMFGNSIVYILMGLILISANGIWGIPEVGLIGVGDKFLILFLIFQLSLVYLACGFSNDLSFQMTMMIMILLISLSIGIKEIEPILYGRIKPLVLVAFGQGILALAFIIKVYLDAKSKN